METQEFYLELVGYLVASVIVIYVTTTYWNRKREMFQWRISLGWAIFAIAHLLINRP